MLLVQPSVLIGRGAGQDATSSSVISDIADAVSLLKGASPIDRFNEVGSLSDDEKCVALAKAEVLESRYYIRFKVKDERRF